MLGGKTIIVLVATVSCLLTVSAYPITASWFRDRYSKKEWDQVLHDFQKFGGDTVWLRGPSLIPRTSNELGKDPNFVWCGSQDSATKVTGTRCWEEAEQELSALGLNVTGFLTYEYEENFSQNIMLCPKYDRLLNSSRIYYRIVLPASKQSSPCDLPAGTNVYVIFTSFAGTDPHALLLESAAEKNITVYYGLPSFPISGSGFDKKNVDVYYGWVERVLHEHRRMYSRDITLYKALKGYYSTDEVCLAQVVKSGFYLDLYDSLGKMVHQQKKLLAISPFVDVVRYELNATVADHVDGLVAIAKLGNVDVIAVQEGRGAGKGCYYWETQIDQRILEVDPMLFDVLKYRNPEMPSGSTYRDVCSASNQKLFKEFGKAHDELKKDGVQFEFWLNVEAFEYLRTDPCLPVDIAASGMGELLNRASRPRIDQALTVAGATVQNVISFAWDSDYTCTTKNYSVSLSESIITDNTHPIMSNCSFHSSHNLSVVILGYNLAQETQSFTIHWTDTSGRARKDVLYGYYFEMDYGERNDRVNSLEYVMLWDTYDWQQLSPKGNVTVQAEGSFNICIFVYDYSY